MITREQLEGRMAKCHGPLVPSEPGLPFFQFRGEGSRDATQLCGVCGYHLIAHTPEIMAKPHMKRIEPHEFAEHGPWEYDLYYCGCRGWD